MICFFLKEGNYSLVLGDGLDSSPPFSLSVS